MSLEYIQNGIYMKCSEWENRVTENELVLVMGWREMRSHSNGYSAASWEGENALRLDYSGDCTTCKHTKHIELYKLNE